MSRKPKSKVVSERHISAPVIFAPGESVKIAKKSRVVDKARAHENLPPEARVPIDMDVTGVEGEVCGTPYHSSDKGGEVCVPIQMRDGNVLGVPAKRLERLTKTPRLDSSESIRESGQSAMSAGSMKYWENHFRQKFALEEENARLKRENSELKKKDRS